MARAEHENRERAAREREIATGQLSRLERELIRKEEQLAKARAALRELGRARFWPEDVAYWYFRLNGCLTTRNFVLHPPRRGSQQTDADLLAVRFPFRQEQNLVDDTFFRTRKKPILMLVEVKAGACLFNGPWTNPKEGNLLAVLQAVGFVSPKDLQAAADEIYRRGRHTADKFDIVLVAVGNRVDPGLAKQLPGSIQITWAHVLTFVLDRFITYHNQKAHHPQWDPSGKELFELAYSAHGDRARFVRAASAKFSIRPDQTDVAMDD